MDRFDFLHCNMIGNRHEICGETEPKEEDWMQFEKKITCTIHPLPKSQARHFTFRFIILQRVEGEDGARATPARARIPVPPWHTELVEQTAICNSKLLNIVSRPSAPPLPPFRRADKCFFPACSFNICHPKSGVGRRSREVCLSRRRRTGLFCIEGAQTTARDRVGRTRL